MKPKLIAISANISLHGELESHGYGVKDQDLCILATDYIESIITAGALPLIISPSANFSQAQNLEYFKQISELADGLLLSGGADLDPFMYNEATTGKCAAVNSCRDFCERALLDVFYQTTNKPIFGICRGLQLLNVYFGGTLYQDLPEAGFNSHSITCKNRFDPVHQINSQPELEQILGDNAWVNSYHHQAIKDLAPGFEVLATSPDGVIEAIKLKSERFVFATQWHPEMMSAHHSKQSDIFKYFISHC